MANDAIAQAKSAFKQAVQLDITRMDKVKDNCSKKESVTSLKQNQRER